MANRRFGLRQLTINGEVKLANGGVDYSLGGDKQESKMGVDRFHGVTITRIMAYLEVTITDDGSSGFQKAITGLTDATVQAELENGKIIKLGHAFYVGEGKTSAASGELEAKFEADPENAEEI
ncbi:MAG: phage tail tube protein [Actinomycetota bacterium]